MPKQFRLVVAIGLMAGMVYVGTSRWWMTDSIDSSQKLVRANKLTNAECQQCHQAVWDEWRESMHSVSWTSPNVQAAFAHFGHDRKCESCHAPNPVFVTGLDKPVEFRLTNREQGVDCISCHQTADNRVAARQTNDDAPCRPIASADLQSSLQCSSCHTAIYEDWEASTYAASGKSCQSCHMPPLADREHGFSHLYLGGHHDETVRKAARLTCIVQDDQLIVTVANVGAGHNFPGERHNRVLLVELFEYSQDGKITLGQQSVIKDITPFRGESSTENIRAGSQVVLEFPVVAESATAEVRLLYKRFPWITDRDALVVHREEIEFE